MITVTNLGKNYYERPRPEKWSDRFFSFFSSEKIEIQALKNISFAIQSGEKVGLIGPNGAGKSSLIKILSGIMHPSLGQCHIHGIIPYQNRQLHSRQMAVVFGQRTTLWWDLPSFDSLRILQKIYDIPEKDFQKKIQLFKEKINLDSIAHTPIRKLSLGQRIRLEVAAGLLHSPKVLFLDEPTIGLDPLSKDLIRSLILEVQHETQMTLLVTSHDSEDIQEMCDKIIVLISGEIHFCGTQSELMAKFHTGFKESIKAIYRSGSGSDTRRSNQGRGGLS